MVSLDEKSTAAAELILKRPLDDDERFEIYRIADVLGMRDVQSFLHLLLVFKLHENTMSEKFAEMETLAGRIDDTLKTSIEKILGDGAVKIGQDMGACLAERAKEALGARDDYQFLRGQLCTVCSIGVLTAAAYWLGTVNALGGGNGILPMGPLGILFMLPAGWWIFCSWSLCTFMWAYDHWKLVKKSSFYKSLFVLQCFVTAALLAFLL